MSKPKNFAMAKHGYVVLADITGYTKFLVRSEFEHAQDILEELFAVILERLKSPLVLSNIEGDAFLAHARNDTVHNSTIIIDALEALYWGFRARVQHMLRNTTCECAACRNVANLDLKLIVHYGEYIEHELAGRKELSGPDIILAHRLLKNEIAKQTGIVSYAAFTTAAVTALGLPTYFAEARLHSEPVEEFGEIETRIIDMGLSWTRFDATQEVVLGDDTDRWIDDISHDFPYDAQLLWHYLTAAEQRPRYSPGVDSVTRTKSSDGRMTAGTVDHCAHGKQSAALITIDARPYRHFTMEVALPMNARIRSSILLQALEHGTRITVRSAKATAGNACSQAIMRLMTRLYVRRAQQGWVQSLTKLEAIIADDLVSGAIQAETAEEITADHMQGKIRDAVDIASKLRRNTR